MLQFSRNSVFYIAIGFLRVNSFLCFSSFFVLSFPHFPLSYSLTLTHSLSPNNLSHSHILSLQTISHTLIPSLLLYEVELKENMLGCVPLGPIYSQREKNRERSVKHPRQFPAVQLATILPQVALIPESAHGTNPASASLAGLDVVYLKTDKTGQVSLDHWKESIDKHKKYLACVMITYPSTNGIFESTIK